MPALRAFRVTSRQRPNPSQPYPLGPAFKWFRFRTDLLSQQGSSGCFRTRACSTKNRTRLALAQPSPVPLGTSDSPLDYLRLAVNRSFLFPCTRGSFTPAAPFVSRISTLPWRTKYSTAPATVSASAAVLLRNSVVIDVHSERNRTNRLTVSFRSPRQLLPGVLLRFRCYNIYLDRVRIMRRYGINHRTWFLGPPRGQDRTQCDLSRSVGIVMN